MGGTFHTFLRMPIRGWLTECAISVDEAIMGVGRQWDEKGISPIIVGQSLVVVDDFANRSRRVLAIIGLIPFSLFITKN